MPFLSGTTFDPTGDPIIDVLADGIVWNLSRTSTITWAVADGLNDYTWVDRNGAIRNFNAALASIEPFIDVTFAYLGDFDSPIAAGEAGADIVYTLDNAVVSDGTLAYAYYPGPGVFLNTEQYATEGGDVFMNFSDPIISSSSFRPGSDGFLTIIHEIGHALGLKHPFDDSPGRPTIDMLDQGAVRDLDWFTIMSYTDQYANEMERWDPATPMLLDVLALQYMYGPNPSTNAGDTILRLESEDFYYTLYDASGNDRVDASGQSEGWTVILPDVNDTPLVDTLAGFALPSSQYKGRLTDSAPREMVWLMGDIENATGSQFDDRIDGNRFNNDLRGGSGNDALEGLGGDDIVDGNGGVDTALYRGAQSNYSLTLSPTETLLEDRRADGTGTDTLINIELINFYSDETSQTFDLRQFGGPAGLSAADLESFIELYIAYFDRAPDAVGLNFWGTAFANGISLEQIASQFIDQDETRDRYPADLSNLQFVTAVYDNVLGRTPDQAGLEFWVDVLDSGRKERDQFILEILRGAKAAPDLDASDEFINQQIADRFYLSDKTDIGAYFAVHLGMSDVDNAIEAMAFYNGSLSSISDAIALMDQYHSAALDPINGEFLMPLVGVLDDPFAALG